QRPGRTGTGTPGVRGPGFAPAPRADHAPAPPTRRPDLTRRVQAGRIHGPALGPGLAVDARLLSCGGACPGTARQPVWPGQAANPVGTPGNPLRTAPAGIRCSPCTSSGVGKVSRLED